MKTKITVLLIVVSLFAAGCGVKGDRQEGGQEDQAPGQNASAMEETIELVETETVELQTIAEEVSVIGKVNAETLIAIGADRSGTVEKINVSVGDRVSAGDVLYTVDRSSVVNDTNSQVTTAKNNLSTAKLNYDNGAQTYEENKRLYDSGIISKSDLDNSYDNMEVLKLNYDNAQSSYDSILRSSAYSLDDTVLVATIDGVISAINVEVGQKSGMKDMEIMGQDKLIIDTVVSNRVMEGLSLGDQVAVTYKETEIQGIISEIGQGGINGTDSFEVSISVDKSDSGLKVGYRVDVLFEVFEEDDQIVVAKKSILSDSEGDYVFVNKGGRAEKVYVTQGFNNSGAVQVFGDIEAGDQLIVKGQNYISEGSKIAAKGEDDEKNS